MASFSTENQPSLTRRFKINTKQEVWKAAKECGLDVFITKVAKAFPDAVDGVRIDAPYKMVWHMQSKEKPR